MSDQDQAGVSDMTSGTRETPRTVDTQGGTRSAVNDLRNISVVMLIALGLEFLLGTATNLYVSIPKKDPWSGATHAGLLYGHAALGVLLFLGSFMLVIRAARSGIAGTVPRSWGVVIGLALATFGGENFVNRGGASWSSLLMAVGFAAAAGFSVVLLHLAGRAR